MNERVSPFTNEAMNKNLLDNAYFPRPVNQRGKTDYSGAGYYIDRWRSWESSASAKLNDGYISVKKQLAQVVENGISILNGKTVSLSLLLNDGRLLLSSGKITHKSSSVLLVGAFSNLNVMLYDDGYNISVQVNTLNDAVFGIVAVKLEFGSVQTLAHLENGKWVINEIPNYSVELLKCQRYYQIFETETERQTEAQDFRPVMRVKPTKGTIEIAEKTYYTADANL